MRVRSVKTIVGALAVALALAVGGCNTGGDESSGNGDEVQLYGTDGNMANSFGDAFKDSAGTLAGMKGTLPLTPLNEDFKRRLKAIDSSLTDFNYAAEAYDAVVVSALAAEAGKTTDSASIGKQIIGVTTGDTSCDSISTCLPLVKAGKRIKYKGVSLRRSGDE